MPILFATALFYTIAHRDSHGGLRKSENMCKSKRPAKIACSFNRDANIPLIVPSISQLPLSENSAANQHPKDKDLFDKSPLCVGELEVLYG